MFTFMISVETQKALVMDAGVLIRYLVLKLDPHTSKEGLLAFFFPFLFCTLFFKIHLIWDRERAHEHERGGGAQGSAREREF